MRNWSPDDWALVLIAATFPLLAVVIILAVILS